MGELASAIDLGGARIQSGCGPRTRTATRWTASTRTSPMPRLAGCPTTRWTAERRSRRRFRDHGHRYPWQSAGEQPADDSREHPGARRLKLNTRPTHTVRVTMIASDGDPDLRVLPTNANAEKGSRTDESGTDPVRPGTARAAIDDDEDRTGSGSSEPLVQSAIRPITVLVLPDVVVVADERAVLTGGAVGGGRVRRPRAWTTRSTSW